MNFRTVAFFALLIFRVSGTLAWDLESSPTIAVTGTDASLICTITPEPNATAIKSWKDFNNELLFLEKTTLQPHRVRFSATNTSTMMALHIASVQLEDEGVYECSLLGIEPILHKNAQLIVHKYPEVFVENYDEIAIEGEPTTVAKCLAQNSKPIPEIWFSGSDGRKIDVSSTQQIDKNTSSVIDSSLILNAVFTRSDDGKTFTCNARHSDGKIISEVTNKVTVHYGVSASLSNMFDGDTKVLLEDTPFDVRCVTTGNPPPIVTWKFEPDPSLNLTLSGALPDNFETSDDGKRLYTNGAVATQSGTTNNGTFTCNVHNGIGDPQEVSFTLGVYAAPVTTVVTTTDATPDLESLHAGSDAAVIGGVVAVAVFVLIVATILVVRYFMSHKGTYRTHELKRGEPDEGRRNSADEHGGMLDDDSELGEKKRTEYFM